MIANDSICGRVTCGAGSGTGRRGLRHLRLGDVTRQTQPKRRSENGERFGRGKAEPSGPSSRRGDGAVLSSQAVHADPFTSGGGHSIVAKAEVIRRGSTGQAESTQ